MMLLVVEDELQLGKSLEQGLTEAGHTCVWVRSGAEGLSLATSQPFDVVLLDMRMPGLDGMSVLRTIKENWPESEVIIITGYPEIDAAKQAVTLGAYDYLAKPVGPDEVINAATGAMQHKKWALRCTPEGARQ